jgi:hypothetical protein
MDGNIFVLVPVCFRVTFRIGSRANHALLQNGVHLALMSSSVIFSVAALLSGTCRREHPPGGWLAYLISADSVLADLILADLISADPISADLIDRLASTAGWLAGVHIGIQHRATELPQRMAYAGVYRRTPA